MNQVSCWGSILNSLDWNDGIFSISILFTLQATNMTMENQPFESMYLLLKN